MKADERYAKRIERLLSTERRVRRDLRLALLLAVLLALWVFPHELGVFSGPPASLFGLSMWAMIVLSGYFLLRLRYVALLRWQGDHPKT